MNLSRVAALMLISASVCQAQSVSTPATNNMRPVAACDREHAQKLIARLIDEARKLTDPALRVSALRIIADRLWSYDEGRARALFQEADDLAAVENAASAQSPQSNSGGSASAIDPRFTVIEAVAHHDKAWARRLIDSADEQYERNHPAGRGDQFQHQRYSMWQLQQLAISLLPTDQDAAIDFMRGSFRFPVAGQLPLFLFQLASRDQQAADALYQEAFKTYRAGDITAILGLSAYPLGVSLLYAGLTDVTAFEAIDSAVEAMNSLVLPDPALGSISWRFSGTRYQNGWTQMLDDSSLENTFNQLAALDFERAMSLANKVADRRSHAIAILGIAKRCLD